MVVRVMLRSPGRGRFFNHDSARARLVWKAHISLSYTAHLLKRTSLHQNRQKRNHLLFLLQRNRFLKSHNLYLLLCRNNTFNNLSLLPLRLQHRCNLSTVQLWLEDIINSLGMDNTLKLLRHNLKSLNNSTMAVINNNSNSNNLLNSQRSPPIP